MVLKMHICIFAVRSSDIILCKSKTGKSVGIDLVLKSFATLSDNVVIDNIKFFREKQSEIIKIQKHLFQMWMEKKKILLYQTGFSSAKIAELKLIGI